MKVNETTKAVDSMRESWKVVNPLMEGTAAMRHAGAALLPKWPMEDEDSWKARRDVATLYPAYRRTVTVMGGKPFSKQITLDDDVPPRIEEMAQDIDLEGRNLHVVAAEVFELCVSHGLTAVLVDFPVTAKDGVPPRTIAAEKAIGARPYFVHIKPKQILGWKTMKVNGALALKQVRFMECVEEDDGEFGTAHID